MQYQIEDFLYSIGNGTEPAVTGEDGRRTVELFTAIYRSSRDNMPVKFPLKPEPGFDGRKWRIRGGNRNNENYQLRTK